MCARYVRTLKVYFLNKAFSTHPFKASNATCSNKKTRVNARTNARVQSCVRTNKYKH